MGKEENYLTRPYEQLAVTPFCNSNHAERRREKQNQVDKGCGYRGKKRVYLSMGLGNDGRLLGDIENQSSQPK